MTRDELAFWLSVAGMACWGACFLWMHQISAKQNRLLAELREQAARIEALSKTEHDLIKEVHPQVGEIKASMDEVLDAVKQDADSSMEPES